MTGLGWRTPLSLGGTPVALPAGEAAALAVAPLAAVTFRANQLRTAVSFELEGVRLLGRLNATAPPGRGTGAGAQPAVSDLLATLGLSLTCVAGEGAGRARGWGFGRKGGVGG